MRDAVRPDPPSGLAGLGILAVFWAVLPLLAGGAVLWFLEPLSDFLRQNLLLGWLLYLGVFAFGAGLGLVPTYAMALLGGWVFGPLAGAVGALLGCTAASALGYVISRGVSRASLVELVRRFPKVKALYDDLVLTGTRRSVVLVAVLRLPPQCPFALANLVMGAAAVPFRAFLLGTLVGMFPRTLIAVLFASAGAATGARSLQELVASGPGWPALVLGIVAMVVAFACVGWLGRSALNRIRQSQAGESLPFKTKLP